MLGAAPERILSPGEPPLRSVEGRIVDASPHLLVLRYGVRELRMPMSEKTLVWYGGRAGLGELLRGRDVVVRPTGDGLAADRIWVDIVRVSGTIIRAEKDVVEVDQGPHRPRTRVVIPRQNQSQILVRHPRMEPGQLFDVIGRSSRHGVVAVKPGTAQPGDIAPPPARPGGSVVRGTATWFSGAGRGAAYPRVDRWGDAGGCADAPQPCAPVPFLSVGSAMKVRNDCTRRSADVIVLECGCAGARFCDRCVECGTSPRGRIIELTPASFVDLGGDLADGCFNVTVAVGG
ncbi:hypothetical protein GCM10010468_31720 [Actinocorallia longicatena]|uniref:DUF5666 domain-containing protein n=1 Tax=Actinocorallia longicatena TaxID=111803 RepID=A0ABP6Q9H9_9ACTN